MNSPMDWSQHVQPSQHNLLDSTVDAYPTRSRAPEMRSGRMPWIERMDPTVWSSRGISTRHDIDGHDRRGYTVNKGLLTVSQVQQVWGEIEQLLDSPALDSDPRVVREENSGEIRSIFEIHALSDVISSIARDDRVLGVAQQLLGSEVYLHQSRINYMPGFVGKGFYWHSDFETWHAEDGLPRPRAVSLSLALSDNYPFNGGLMVVPGSHQHFIPCIGDTPDDNHKQSLVAQESGVPSHDDMTELVAEYGIDQFTGSAGDGLWFDSNIMHGSGSNITPYQRSNIFLVFNSVDNAPVLPFDGQARRPEHIASTNTSPLR